MHDNRVLVAGTTPDYINWIRQTKPGECLFLTDSTLRHNSIEPTPAPIEEVLFDAKDLKGTKKNIDEHLKKYNIKLIAIVCYDCESMELTSFLANQLGLRYPSLKSIKACKNKHISKLLWKKNNVNCPSFKKVNTPEQLEDFLDEIKSPCVVKPLSGSGSELVFRINNHNQCKQAFEQAMKFHVNKNKCIEEFSFLAEKLIEGEEYSCDFAVEKNNARIIRITRKYHLKSNTFGIIQAYELTSNLPGNFSKEKLEMILYRAATSLGIKDIICMTDLIFCDNEPYIIELSPRPGGDCLPHLLKIACDLDIIGYHIDHTLQKKNNNKTKITEPFVGLRIFAPHNGKLANINTSEIPQNHNIIHIENIRKSGDIITIPPDDYDSWILSHVIYKPISSKTIEKENQQITAAIKVEIHENK